MTPWTVARWAPLSMGFSRQEHWREWPFLSPGDLPDPEIDQIKLTSPALGGRFFTTEPPRKSTFFAYCICIILFYSTFFSNQTLAFLILTGPLHSRISFKKRPLNDTPLRKSWNRTERFHSLLTAASLPFQSPVSRHCAELVQMAQQVRAFSKL